MVEASGATCEESDSDRSTVNFGDYSDGWLVDRYDLAERTVELYRWLLDRKILPTFRATAVATISPAAVRSWNAEIAKRTPTTAAKAYRLLSAIMRTAVADEVVSRNPCRVRGAGVEKAPERPVASVAQVQSLVDAMPDNLRIAILLAAWCQLRRGELLGLRRRDVDLERGTVTIAQTRSTTMAGTVIQKEPKTAAGKRTVFVPANVLPALAQHLDKYVGSGLDSLIISVTDRALGVAWNKARQAVGRSDLHLHDLRHSGLTWSAAAGATVAELMRRAGHASPAAAMRYQHATEDRDRVLANALASLAAYTSRGASDASARFVAG